MRVRLRWRSRDVLSRGCCDVLVGLFHLDRIYLHVEFVDDELCAVDEDVVHDELLSDILDLEAQQGFTVAWELFATSIGFLFRGCAVSSTF